MYLTNKTLIVSLVQGADDVPVACESESLHRNRHIQSERVAPQFCTTVGC